MAKKVIIVLLIISLNFVSFADEATTVEITEYPNNINGLQKPVENENYTQTIQSEDIIDISETDTLTTNIILDDYSNYKPKKNIGLFLATNGFILFTCYSLSSLIIILKSIFQGLSYNTVQFTGNDFILIPLGIGVLGLLLSNVLLYFTGFYKDAEK